MSREPKRLGALGTVIMVLVILGIIAATGFVVWLCIDMVNLQPENAPSTDQSVVMPTESQAPTTEMPTETTVPPTTKPPIGDNAPTGDVSIVLYAVLALSSACSMGLVIGKKKF